MIIYQLKIISIEDEKISEKTLSYETELGYYSSLENVKNAIIKIYMSFDEPPIAIFCESIEIDEMYSNCGITHYFNKEGDIISINILDSQPSEINKDYKFGDIVAVHHKDCKPMKIGIVSDVASIENTYCVEIYDNELIDGVKEYGLKHIHIFSEEMFKTNSVSPEIVYFLKTQLKDMCSKSDYQKLFREDKLKRLTNDGK